MSINEKGRKGKKGRTEMGEMEKKVSLRGSERAVAISE